MSGCQAWAAFGPTPTRPIQEQRWIAAIDAAWPGLSGAERRAVQAYANRWGPNSAPINPVAGTEAFVRYFSLLFI